MIFRVQVHARDKDGRALGLELTRDHAESRIEQLHEGKQREDKARAEAEKKAPPKKPVRTLTRKPEAR